MITFIIFTILLYPGINDLIQADFPCAVPICILDTYSLSLPNHCCDGCACSVIITGSVCPIP